MSLRFGTDGVRGVAFEQLTEQFAYSLGAASARLFAPGGSSAMYVGRDTRESGPALLAAFAAGVATTGVEVLDLGVVPTPAVAWFCAHEGQPGAMLSASHNPWTDNGIKIFGPGGRKLSDEQQTTIEAALDNEAAPSSWDSVTVSPAVAERYIDAVVQSAERRFDGLSIVVDCANGSAAAFAPEIFARLGATVTAIAAAPNGRNINDNVGSTHPEALQAAVLDTKADMGFAFDGDADRVLGCDASGNLIDGDQIIAMAAIDRKSRGALASDTVVITVMTNLGFRLAMADQGIEIVETGVGDRHVLAALDEQALSLGGEQSGHIIHRDMATTGDGVLTAVQLVDAVLRRPEPIGVWAANVMTQYPQVLQNVRLQAKVDDITSLIATEIASEEALLGDQGRVLVRASGTEPLIRVMVEAATHAQAEEVAGRLAEAVTRLTS